LQIHTETKQLPSRNGKTSSGRICPRNKFSAKELVSDTRLSTASAALVFTPATNCQYLQQKLTGKAFNTYICNVTDNLAD